MTVLRIVSFNTLFGGRNDDGLGDNARWREAAPFLRSLDADIYALQECNFWELLGERRLHQACAELGMSSAYLAEANATTADHRFHTALLANPRWAAIGQGAERNKYHHVLGWANGRVDDGDAVWSIRNLHLDPFSPAHRTAEVEPLQTLAAPGRLSLVLGDANMLGIGHAEPDWSPLPRHLHHTQLVRTEDGRLVADRTAANVLEGAGFVDAAHHVGDDRPTGGFGKNDVERRQDLFLLSSVLAEAIVAYDVHTEPIEQGFSDHCAISLTLDCDRLAGGTA
ncbi:endonuclease/exonuclease/phosphatase family protein [Streptomyces nodosus]|uniref:endonuclease/exonuclease/phosphatase family protein n=1 Tax=Streptomyces nodosus TaxID=40318 RepID=UPI003454F5D3